MKTTNVNVEVAILEMQDQGYLEDSTLEMLTAEEYIYVLNTVRRKEMTSR